MNVPTMPKDQLLNALQALLTERKPAAPRTATKQEVAVRAADQQMAELASTYTVEDIVKGFANLQLEFGKTVDQLVAQLAVESPKLEQIRQAIRIETQHLQESRNIRIVADALELLVQEHQEATTAFASTSQQERQALEKEIATTRQTWQKEQQEFDRAAQERQELLKKEREQSDTDYQYELERQRKMEADDYASRKTAIERKLAEEDAKRSSDWSEREKMLAAQQENLQKYKALVETFPQELEAAISKAREETFSEIAEEARIQAELSEQDLAATTQAYDLQFATLQETITQQTKQIEQLSAQLQAAVQQVQDLAAKAVERTSTSTKSNYKDFS